MVTSATIPSLTFLIDDIFLEDIRALPWQRSIEDWKELGVRLVSVRKGMGRHPIVFVQVARQTYVIKELPGDESLREISNYRVLLERGIHTLVPIGSVLREEGSFAVETRTGHELQPHTVGHTVTLLLDRVIPDSELYRRAFTFENRKRIWDAVIDLFVDLHSRGVYWGDASLANTLVKFLRVDVPYIGKKVELKAFLADAETVEIYDSLSDSLRAADVEYFIDSMEWINEDLKSEGILKDPLATLEDIEYIRNTYQLKFEANQKLLQFEKRTGLNVQRLLGRLRIPVEVELLKKHIEEHKWYVSEQKGKEINIREAAAHWHDSVFVPICELFQREGVPRFFPGKTAAELYVEIMTHKYFLGVERGEDVGMAVATRDYVDRFGSINPLAAFWNTFSRKLTRILELAETGFTGMSK